MTKVKNLVATLFVLACALWIGGCATTVSDTADSAYAPKQEKKMEGTIVYNPDGVADLVKIRRQNAYKQIYDICGSDNYTIVNEEDRKQDPKASSRIATSFASRLHYMHYRCNI